MNQICVAFLRDVRDLDTRTKALLVLALCSPVLVVIGVCSVLWYLVLRDGVPVNDVELRIVRRVVSPEDNGFELLHNLSRAEVVSPDPKDRYDLEDDVFADGSLWSAEGSREAVRRNQRILNKLDESLERPDFHVPEEVFEPGREVPLSAWSALARVISQRVRLHYSQDEMDLAFADALRLVRFGRKIQGSQGDLFFYFTGLNVEAMGLKNLLYLLEHSDLDRAGLEECARLLDDARVKEDAIADAYKVDYMILSRLIDRVSQEPSEMRQNLWGFYSESEVERNLGVGEGISEILFNPNDTKRLVAQFYRALVGNVGRPWSQRQSIVAAVGLGRTPLRNRTGRLLCKTLARSRDESQVTRYSHEFLRTATRALLALYSYRKDNGELPERIDELVPQHLEIVPLDPFDGEPLRYSRARRVLYSVGVDLKDAGGADVDPKDSFELHPSEPTILIGRLRQAPSGSPDEGTGDPPPSNQ